MTRQGVKTDSGTQWWRMISESLLVCKSIDLEYKQLAVVAASQHGIVSAAESINDRVPKGTLVALKKVDASIIGEFPPRVRRAQIAAVLYEIRVLRKLSLSKHQNIVQFLEVVVDSLGNVFIVMEKADMDLLELINRRGRLSEREACRIMKQIVSGVAHLHSLGMIHLDLSLENCLVFQNQSIVKICDFGHVGEVISKTVSSSRGPWNQGKILYTAPEHFYSSHAPSVLTDSYSLGIILFVLLFGRLPYVVASSCSPEFMALSYGDVEEFLNIVSESEVYSNLSKPVLNLLRRTLCGSSNRLPPQDILVHPWFLIHN